MNFSNENPTDSIFGNYPNRYNFHDKNSSGKTALYDIYTYRRETRSRNVNNVITVKKFFIWFSFRCYFIWKFSPHIISHISINYLSIVSHEKTFNFGNIFPSHVQQQSTCYSLHILKLDFFTWCIKSASTYFHLFKIDF